MAGMSMKEIARIIEWVEPQGVAVTRTKKGLLLRLPNGETEMIHFTTSDHRAYANTRAHLHRAGISMPTDKHAAKNLPDYITAGSMRQSTLDRAARKIEDMGSPRQITATEFIEAGGAPNHGLANRTLYHLGWLPQTDKKRAHKVWLRPLDQEDEPMTEEQVLLGAGETRGVPVPFKGNRKGLAYRIYQLLVEEEAALSHAEIAERIPDAKSATVSSALTAMRKRGLIDLHFGRTWAVVRVQPQVGPDREQLSEPEVEQEQGVEQEQEAQPVRTGTYSVVGDREFIDSVNSWTLDLSILDGGMTIEQLRRTLRATGLDFEVRVWHENEIQ